MNTAGRIVAFATVSLVLAGSVAVHAAKRRTPVVVAVENVSPAVVNINTLIRQAVNPFRRRGMGDFFGGMFGAREVERTSLGSGVIIRKDGYILTNNHVIDGATSIMVSLSGDREFPAEVIGADARSDLAVIKISSKSALPVAKMTTSNDLMIGETVIAIGNPFGLSHTVTTGIVSAVGRDIKGANGRIYQDFIQLDASINPGNSGGPLLNINGEVIGVTTAIYRSAEGIGFAIPIDRARRIVDDLIKHGEVHRGFVGFFTEDMGVRLRAAVGWDEKGGVIVRKVVDPSPATDAGIEPGDVIYSIQEKRVSNRSDFVGKIASFTKGDRIAVGFFRKGHKHEVALYAGEVTAEVADKISREWLGVSVMPMSRRVKLRYGLTGDEGVVIVEIDAKSELASIGVRPGDIIRRINRTVTNTMKGFRKAIMDGQNMGAALVFIQRGNNIYSISIEG